MQSREAVTEALRRVLLRILTTGARFGQWYFLLAGTRRILSHVRPRSDAPPFQVFNSNDVALSSILKWIFQVWNLRRLLWPKFIGIGERVWIAIQRPGHELFDIFNLYFLNWNYIFLLKSVVKWHEIHYILFSNIFHLAHRNTPAYLGKYLSAIIGTVH